MQINWQEEKLGNSRNGTRRLILAFVAMMWAGCASAEIVSLQVTAPRTTLLVGETVQLTVTAVLEDGSTMDVTSAVNGTLYESDKPVQLGVDPNGRVSVLATEGRCVGCMEKIGVFAVSTSPDIPVAGLIEFTVMQPDDDNDLLGDTWEGENGFNAGNPADGVQDADGDTLTNLQEFQMGTDPRNPDTDGDGVNDGEEVRRGSDPTNPVQQFVLGENCTASVLNRTVRIRVDGSFTIPNIPSIPGLFRARVVCAGNDGELFGGLSAFLQPAANETVNIGRISLGPLPPSVDALSVGVVADTLNTPGDSSQLTVTATLSDGTMADLTPGATGTTYVVSNNAVAAVSADGRVTAGSQSGTAIISITNDGVFTSKMITVALDEDADDDGLPDDFELANGLDPDNPADAGQDVDGDGRSALQEFDGGTDPNLSDTDGDGLNDGQEVAVGSNPVAPDSDLDGVLDGAEPSPTADFDGDGLANVLDPDSDNDGLDDGIEVALAGSTTGASANADGDGDTLVNGDEVDLNTDPGNPDTDGDGLTDGEEVVAGLDPLVSDSEAPMVALTGPAAGTELVEGETVTLSAEASDDGRVTRVDFLVDGVVVGATTAEPFETPLTVPLGQDLIEIDALAVDTNDNTANAGALPFAVIPDPLTTAAGRILDQDGALAEGAVATVRLPDQVFETGFASAMGGPFTVDPTTNLGVQNLSGEFLPDPGLRPVSGQGVDLGGVGPFELAGSLTLDFTGFDPLVPVPLDGTLSLTATSASGVSFTAEGPVDDVVLAAGPIDVTGVVQAANVLTPFQPLQVTLPVTAFDANGVAEVAPLEDKALSLHLEGTYQVEQDADTLEVLALFFDAEAQGLAAAEPSDLAGPNGEFSIGGVPTILGDIAVDARLEVAGQPVQVGRSAATPPVRGGITEVGTIQLAEAGCIPLDNAGFEDQVDGLAGWTVVDQPGGSGTWFVQSGSASPTSGFDVPPPPEGQQAAMSDQSGPGSHLLFRDIALPSASGLKIAFDLYLGNRSTTWTVPASGTLDFGAGANQHVRVDIMDPSAPDFDVGAGVLRNLFLTDPGTDPLESGYRTVIADIGGLAGSTVRLRFAEVDNQFFLQMGVDNLRICTGEVPDVISGPTPAVVAPAGTDDQPPARAYGGPD